MPTTATGTIDRDALDRYVGRVLALHNERGEINAQIHDVYEEAKNAGFVTKIIRQIVTEQKMDADTRHSHYAHLDTYRRALGMLDGTPLGEAAIERATPVERPTPFAEQPLKRAASRAPRRKQRTLDELLTEARSLGNDMAREPVGTA